MSDLGALLLCGGGFLIMWSSTQQAIKNLRSSRDGWASGHLAVVAFWIALIAATLVHTGGRS